MSGPGDIQRWRDNNRQKRVIITDSIWVKLIKFAKIHTKNTIKHFWFPCWKGVKWHIPSSSKTTDIVSKVSRWNFSNKVKPFLGKDCAVGGVYLNRFYQPIMYVKAKSASSHIGNY